MSSATMPEANAEPLLDRLILWIDPVPRAGAWNMALDQALLETTDAPVLRVYSWTEPAVTIGYAQKLEALKPSLPGWPVTRRWTGGGVVYHDADHTYSVIVPASSPWAQTRPVESYRLIHDSLAKALVGAGFADCRLAVAEDVIDKPFCFEAPAVHDIVRGAVKIAGAGQRRSRIGFLHQGSVQQVDLDSDFWRKWAAAIASDVSEMSDLTSAVQTRAQELATTRYGADSWLHEREDAREH
jgi:lipoyl(octanoyl) transferase